MAEKSKTKRILRQVGHELKVNEPAVVKKTRRKKGQMAAEKVRKAVLLDKARRRGARIKKK